MQQTYKVPNNITAILKTVDYLGFDTRNECCNAILDHEDWQERWEVTDLLPSELRQLIEWRNETLAALTEYNF